MPETPDAPSEADVSALMKLIGEVMVDAGVEAAEAAMVDTEPKAGESRGEQQEKGDGAETHSRKKLHCHQLGSRAPAQKGTDPAEQNIESLLTMERVTGRKTLTNKRTRDFVEQTAIGMAKRSYAATYCHITGDIHSQLTKQKLAGMIAGTEAAVANVVNNADK